MKIRLLGSMIAGLALASCTHYPDYPSLWQPPVIVQGCPMITGEYQDLAVGENIQTGLEPPRQEEGYAISLYSILFSGPYQKHGTVDHVNILQLESELRMEAYKDGSLVASATARFLTSQCENGFLTIKAPKKDHAEPVLGVFWESLKMMRSADGALIVRYDSKGAGFYFLPFAGSQWVWYRFPKWENQ